MLILCFVPPVGMKVNGAWRWVNLGFASFQPSELGKIAVLFFLASWYARHEEQAAEFWRGFVLPLAAAGIIMALIVVEVDLGATALIGTTALAMAFVAGAGWRWLLPLIGAGVAVLCVAAYHIEARFSIRKNTSWAKACSNGKPSSLSGPGAWTVWVWVTDGKKCSTCRMPTPILFFP